VPRLIFKCPYLKGGSHTTVQRENYLRYIATREGVELLLEHPDWPATQKQKELIQQLNQDFPSAQTLFEYEDYRKSPTRKNAAELIDRVLEDHFLSVSGKKRYMEYIAQRPRVELHGAHGLFTGGDRPVILSQAAQEVSQHTGPIWLPILSLRREDAARLGYDNAESWRKLLTSHAPKMAQAMKIPLKDFRWYAAFHNEGHHPHVHMICYSTNPSKGYLTKSGIAQIKSALVNDLFRNDLMEIYGRQTEKRNSLSRETKEVLNQLIQEMQETKSLDNSHLADLLLQLADRLRFTSGKKQYGYLKAPLKSLVDEIVDELEKEPVVKEAYGCWYELREEVLRSYRDDLPERLPLSQQKEFKNIKNLVIHQASALNSVSEIFISDEDASQENEMFLNDDLQDDMESKMNDTFFVGVMEYQLAKKCLIERKSDDRNYEKAYDLFLQAAERGNVFAMYELGQLHRKGIGCEYDKEKAAEYFSQALKGFLKIEEKKENSNLQYRIGCMYLYGIGTEVDISKAEIWFRKSAEGGNIDGEYQLAKLILDDLYRDPTKTKEAIANLYKSAQAGHARSQYLLGKILLQGEGQYRAEGIRWLTMSADQGNEYARQFLVHQNDVAKAAAFQSAGQLLRQLGNLFREQTPVSAIPTPQLVDQKLKRKIQEKKKALGLKQGGPEMR